MILYPNTAFQLNEYLDRQTTSEIHCRTHCACCAPQRHLAGYDIPLCQFPSFMEKDVVALGRAVLPTWSSLSENEDTSQRVCCIAPCSSGKRNTRDQFSLWLHHHEKSELSNPKQLLHSLYVQEGCMPSLFLFVEKGCCFAFAT